MAFETDLKESREREKPGTNPYIIPLGIMYTRNVYCLRKCFDLLSGVATVSRVQMFVSERVLQAPPLCPLLLPQSHAVVRSEVAQGLGNEKVFRKIQMGVDFRILGFVTFLCFIFFFLQPCIRYPFYPPKLSGTMK